MGSIDLEAEDKISCYCPFQGTVAWDFLSKVILPKVPNWSPDSYTKAFSNVDSSSPRNLTSKVLTCYGPLRQILCAMGPCGKFGYTLWAIVADFVMRYRHYAVWGHTVKICDDFCSMGHSAGFGYLLWAVAKDLVKHYGPCHSIWLCAIGHSKKPITIAQN